MVVEVTVIATSRAHVREASRILRLGLAVAVIALLLAGCAPLAARLGPSGVSPEVTRSAPAAGDDQRTVASEQPAQSLSPAEGRPAEPAPPAAPSAAESLPSPTPVPPPTPAEPPTAVSTVSVPGQPARADDVDRAVQAAIADGLFPGAVVLVSRDGKVVKQTAYGYARLYQDGQTRLADPTPARTNTIFDLASLTKLFTATYVMQLVEAGRLNLDRPVASYLPAFAQNGKARITVRQLLNHSSGLPAGLPLYKVPGGTADRLAAVDAVKPRTPPGAQYLYSDLNYIVLGQLVETLSGQSLAEYGQDHVFGPLGMADTTYNPPDRLRQRIAATEYEPTAGRGMVWGEVHDDNARALGGAAGHAGLFSTASDLAVFAEAMLNGGARGNARILSPESVRAMTRDADGGGHGLGWEVDQDWYMGPLASAQAWGHTGYTGTSLVIDAKRHLVVVLLTNRVHPTHEGPSINPARRAVAAAALRLLGGR